MTPTRRATLIVAAFTVATTSACGIEAAGPTPGQAGTASPTTDAPASTTTTTEPPTTTEAPTTTATLPEILLGDELRALLPTVDELGGGLVETPGARSQLAATDFLDACPDISLLEIGFLGIGGESASFEAPDGGVTDVSAGTPILFQGAELDDEEVLDGYISNIDGCPFDFDLTNDGVTARVSGTMSARRDDTFGDSGVRLTAPSTITGPDLRSDINFTIEALYWANANVGASVTVQSGVDDDLNEVPGRTELLLLAVETIDGRIDEL